MSELFIKQRRGPFRVGAKKKKKNDIIVAVSMVLIAA